MFPLRLCSAVMIFAPLIAWGQAPRAPGALPKPDFSGRWRMAKELSEFHGFQMPNIVVRIVEDHDPAINVHTIQTTGQNTTATDITYFTDGSITKNVINGRDAESKCYWDGSVLVVRTEMKNPKGIDELITDRWQLSDDGQLLTIASHVETEKGGVDMRLVSKREKIGT